MNVKTSEYKSENTDVINIFQVWKNIVEHAIYVFVFVFVVTLGSVFYTYNLPLVYKADLLMTIPVVNSKSSVLNNFSSLASAIGVEPGSSASSAEKGVARLKTREFLIKHIKNRGLKPILFPKEWTGEKWIDDEPSDIEAYKLLVTLFDIKILKRDLAGFVTLSVIWENPVDPDKVADLANNLIIDLNKEQKDRAIEKYKDKILFLEQELERTSLVKAQASLFSIIESQIGSIIKTNLETNYVFEVIDPAIPPQFPENMLFKKISIILFAFFISLFLSLIFLWAIISFKNMKKKLFINQV